MVYYITIDPESDFLREAIVLQPLAELDEPIPIPDEYSNGTEILVENYPLIEQDILTLSLNDLVDVLKASSYLGMNKTLDFIVEYIATSFTKDSTLERYREHKDTVIELFENVPYTIREYIQFLTKDIKIIKSGLYEASNNNTLNILVLDHLHHDINSKKYSIYNGDVKIRDQIVNNPSIHDDKPDFGLDDNNRIITYFKGTGAISNGIFNIRSNNVFKISNNGSKYIEDRESNYYSSHEFLMNKIENGQPIPIIEFLVENIDQIIVSSNMNVIIKPVYETHYNTEYFLLDLRKNIDQSLLNLSDNSIPLVRTISMEYEPYQHYQTFNLSFLSKILFSQSENALCFISKISDTTTKIDIYVNSSNGFTKTTTYNINNILLYFNHEVDFYRNETLTITDKYIYYITQENNIVKLNRIDFTNTDNEITIVDEFILQEYEYNDNLLENMNEDDRLNFINSELEQLGNNSTIKAKFSLISGINRIILSVADIWDSNKLMIYSDDINYGYTDFIDYLQDKL